MTLPLATTLHDRYRIEGVIGHGGFGITYLAMDQLLNVKVAIKEYLPRQLATRWEGQTKISVFTGEAREHYEYGLRKFLEEAQVLARFGDHPNIVSARDFFEANGTAYMVMPFLEGVTLKEYLAQKGGRLPYEVARDIMLPVMDALREVHNVHLLHRDISPDNIFLTTTQQVKLIDFGAARYQAGEQSKSLSVILKVGYAPEEQYRSSGKQGPWTDVYAAAATFYRAITGQTPPDALDRMAEDTLTAPSRLGAAIPPVAEQALLRALAVNASNRFQTMGEFQQALLGNAAVTMAYQPAAAPFQPAPVHDSPKPAAQPIYPPRLPKRSLNPAAIAAAVVAVIILVGGVSWWQLGRDSSPESAIKPPKMVDREPVSPQRATPLAQAPAAPPEETPPVPQPVKTRFTITKDGVITDSVTGLEWYVGPDRDTSWHQARAWAEGLTAAGGGWRLAAVPELQTLYQPGIGSNNLDPIFPLTGYWAWTGQIKDESFAWGFSFKAGRGLWDRMVDTANGRALAVRSLKEASPVPQPVNLRFTRTNVGVITDSATGLDWYVSPNQGVDWHQAKAWTENLSAAGGGWRMPTVQELKALYQKGADPSNMDPIFQTTGTWVWAGQLKDSSSAYCYSFRYGKEHWWRLDFSYNGRAFAVRSHQGSDARVQKGYGQTDTMLNRPSPSSVSPIDNEEAQAFVINYLNAASSNNLEVLLNYYAPLVDYFDRGMIDKKFIYTDKLNYTNRWPDRKYSIIGDIRIASGIDGSKILEFLIGFVVRNSETGIRGEAVSQMQIKKVNNQIKIVNEKQKVTRREKY